MADPDDSEPITEEEPAEPAEPAAAAEKERSRDAEPREAEKAAGAATGDKKKHLRAKPGKATGAAAGDKEKHLRGEEPFEPGQAAAAAALGGVAPNLLQLGIRLLGDNPTYPVSISGYCLGLLVFALLGAGTAWALGEGTKKRAFLLGISLPALLQAGFMTATATAPNQGKSGYPFEGQKDQKEIHNTSDAAFSFLSRPAFADTLMVDSGEKNTATQALQTRELKALSRQSAGHNTERAMERQLILSLASPLPPSTEVVFLSEERQFTKLVPIWKPQAEREIKIEIPDFADRVIIRSGNVQSDPFDLPEDPNGRVSLEVKVEKSFLGSFLWAFGVTTAETFDLKLKLVTEKETNAKESLSLPPEVIYLPDHGPFNLSLVVDNVAVTDLLVAYGDAGRNSIVHQGGLTTEELVHGHAEGSPPRLSGQMSLPGSRGGGGGEVGIGTKLFVRASVHCNKESSGSIYVYVSGPFIFSSPGETLAHIVSTGNCEGRKTVEREVTFWAAGI